jgi:2-phospho-L-lactate guanylyltransferase
MDRPAVQASMAVANLDQQLARLLHAGWYDDGSRGPQASKRPRRPYTNLAFTRGAVHFVAHGAFRPMTDRAALLVPIKSFRGAKGRLSPVLSAHGREQLARALAANTLAAAGSLCPHVVCGDPAVATAAKALGANVIECVEPGLDIAIATGVTQLGREGFSRVVVAHGDMPLVAGLDRYADPDRYGSAQGIVITPDRHLQGTNIISVPTGANVRWSYGPGSFHRHRGEAPRLGLPLRIVRDKSLGWDLDEPEDLQHMPHLLPEAIASIIEDNKIRLANPQEDR